MREAGAAPKEGAERAGAEPKEDEDPKEEDDPDGGGGEDERAPAEAATP